MPSTWSPKAYEQAHKLNEEAKSEYTQDLTRPGRKVRRISTFNIVVIDIIIQPLRAFRRAHLGENVFGGSLGSLWALWALDIGSM